jgi:hypothetical protein
MYDNLPELLDLRVELKEGQSKFHPRRRFVNVIVENKGRDIARDCEVKLRALHKTDGCEWLSSELKQLAWTDGEKRTTIKAKGGSATFHLAFSQETLTKEQLELIDPVYCGIANDKIKCIAWVATARALQRTEYADQDGLCYGEFVVHIKVDEEYGRGTASKHTFTLRLETTGIN